MFAPRALPRHTSPLHLLGQVQEVVKLWDHRKVAVRIVVHVDCRQPSPFSELLLGEHILFSHGANLGQRFHGLEPVLPKLGITTPELPCQVQSETCQLPGLPCFSLQPEGVLYLEFWRAKLFQLHPTGGRLLLVENQQFLFQNWTTLLKDWPLLLRGLFC